MVANFCLRLAFGMMAPMTILPASVVPPRFFRVQFLSALALIVIAALFLPEPSLVLWIGLGIAAAVALAGSIVWHTDEAPFGRALFFVGAVVASFLVGAVRFVPPIMASEATPRFLNDNLVLFLDDVASGLLLGAAISAMLMGHSYLIAPAMSLTPLNRLLALLGFALGVRILGACVGLYWWTRVFGHTLDVENGAWLGGRWLVGLIIPIGLTWMAWESARIRSTQSATGILYVVTVLVFLGELLSMLLVEKTRVPM